MNETNDCAVKAVAIATGTPYATVHELMTRAGRKPRQGTYPMTTYAVLDQLGYDAQPVEPRRFIDRYPGGHKNAHSVTTHHPARFNKVWTDGETYLLSTRSHILAVVNGRNIDWTKGQAKRVVRIVRVVKRG